jgi:hypothetical protein
MKKSRKRISLRSLSPARQDLIVCMHQKQSGTIRNLPVVAGEPMLQNARVTRRRNLGTKNAAPPVNRFLALSRCVSAIDERSLRLAIN